MDKIQYLRQCKLNKNVYPISRTQIIFLFSQKWKSFNYPQLRWTLCEIVTLIGASALTHSSNQWNPLKGLYLRNVLLVSPKEDSGYIACQEPQTEAKTEAVQLVAQMISLLYTQHKKLKKILLG